MREQHVSAFILDTKGLLRATLGAVFRDTCFCIHMTDSILVVERWMTSSQCWEGWHDLFNREMWGRGGERVARTMKKESAGKGLLELS